MRMNLGKRLSRGLAAAVIAGALLPSVALAQEAYIEMPGVEAEADEAVLGQALEAEADEAVLGQALVLPRAGGGPVGGFSLLAGAGASTSAAGLAIYLLRRRTR